MTLFTPSFKIEDWQGSLLAISDAGASAVRAEYRCDQSSFSRGVSCCVRQIPNQRHLGPTTGAKFPSAKISLANFGNLGDICIVYLYRLRSSGLPMPSQARGSFNDRQ